MSALPAPPARPPGQLAPVGGRAVARDGAPPLDARTRDFLRLTVFVLAQQGFVDRAGVLAEALYLAGGPEPEVQFARAVLRFLAGEWASCLACLEELDRSDPVERFGAYRMDARQRMRRFLAARCLFETGEPERAREALDSYLRRGRADGEDAGEGEGGEA